MFTKRFIAGVAALGSCCSIHAENFSLPNSDATTTWLIVGGIVVLSCLISAGWRRVRNSFLSGLLSFLQGLVIIALTYLGFWILVVHTHYSNLASVIVWPLEKIGWDDKFLAIAAYLAILTWIVDLFWLYLIVPLCRFGSNGLYVVLSLYLYLIVFFTGMRMIQPVDGFIYLLMALAWIAVSVGLYGKTALYIRKWRCNKCGTFNDESSLRGAVSSPGRTSVSYNRSYEGTDRDYGAYGSDYTKRETETYGISRKTEYYMDDTYTMRCGNCGHYWSVTVSRKTGEHSERIGQSDQTTTCR